jgi:predicted DNA-binding transcriptional regulator AlpA
MSTTATATTTATDSDMMTPAQLREQLQISESSYYRLLASDGLPAPIALLSGRRKRTRRWMRSEVLAWISSGCPDRKTWERLKRASR